MVYVIPCVYTQWTLAPTRYYLRCVCDAVDVRQLYPERGSPATEAVLAETSSLSAEWQAIGLTGDYTASPAYQQIVRLREVLQVRMPAPVVGRERVSLLSDLDNTLPHDAALKPRACCRACGPRRCRTPPSPRPS